MQLLFLFFLLTFPYLLLALLSRWTSVKIKPSTRARVGLSVFFAFTAIGHFIRTDEMSAMLPSWVPYRASIIYLTGILELLGGYRTVVAGSDKSDRPFSHLDAHKLFARQHLFGNRSSEFGGHAAGPAYLLLRARSSYF